MNTKLTKILDWGDKAARGIVVWISIVLFSVITLSCYVLSTYFDETYAEHPQFRIDDFLILTLLLVINVFVLRWLDNRYHIERISAKNLVYILAVYSFVISVFWIMMSRNYPVADRYYVSKYAQEFMEGNYGALGRGRYLFDYPYQLGIVAFIQICYTIFGKNYMVIELINCFAVSLIMVELYNISVYVLKNEKAKKMTGIMLFGALCAMFFATYVYGNLVGLAFALIAVHMQLKYMNTDKIRYVIIAVISIVIAILLKSNYSIIMIAMLIVLLMHAIKNRKVIPIVFMVIMVAANTLGFAGLKLYYTNVSGIAVGEGVPKICWFAMGLQEGWFGEGSYNAYTLETYAENDYDSKATSKAAAENLMDSIHTYVTNPGKAVKFFGRKIAYQWTEPTYMSIWESNCVDNHIGEISTVTQSIYTGKMHDIIVGFMNYYQFIVWLGAAVYMIVNRKNMTTTEGILAIIVIGGFLFHLLWEGKSQYILPYFLVAIPYGAGGMEILVTKFEEYVNKSRQRKENEA